MITTLKTGITVKDICFKTHPQGWLTKVLWRWLKLRWEVEWIELLGRGED